MRVALVSVFVVICLFGIGFLLFSSTTKTESLGDAHSFDFNDRSTWGEPVEFEEGKPTVYRKALPDGGYEETVVLWR